MAAVATLHYTREDYLRDEARAPQRNEFRDGSVYAMAGGSMSHGVLIHTLNALLFIATDGTSCRSFGSEIKLRIERANAYYYPDAMIVCGEVEIESETQGIIRNPVVVFEILSPGTHGFDKNEKFLDYQTVPSVREVVFLHSDRPVAQRYERQTDGSWRYTTYIGKIPVALDSVGIVLDLARVYANVFPDDDPVR